MTSAIYSFRPAIALAVFPALCLLLSGCCDEHDSAVCGGRVTEAITSFEVRTVTGNDSSDADMKLCIRTKSPAPDQCELLDNADNNFEEDTVDTFTVDVPVAAGDLDSFFILNAAGAVFGNNEWEIEGLWVEALLESGATVVLYEEPDIGCENDIDSNERYTPLACDY